MPDTIVPLRPTRLETLYRRAFVASVLVVAFLIIVIFLLMLADRFQVGMGSYLLLFMAAFVTGVAGISAGKKADQLEQNRRDAQALVVLNSVKAGKVLRFGVFLRPFYLTGRIERTEKSMGDSAHSLTYTYELEEMILQAFGDLMPLVALGRPGETIGVGRILSDESTWQAAAADMMLRASLIVCVPSSHPGTAWELEQIVKNQYLAKTVFFMPIVGESIRLYTEQRNDWNCVVEVMGRHGISIPQYGRFQMIDRMFSIGSDGTYTEKKVDLRYSSTLRDAITHLVSNGNGA